MKLKSEQIRAVCVEILHETGGLPSVRRVTTELLRRYGARGRNARVAQILKGVIREREVRSALPCDIVVLREQLLEAQRQVARAQGRAERAEKLEERHQDYWAARYQEKLAELQARAAPTTANTVSSEQYLRLYQRAADLARRLTCYEEVEPLRVLGPLR